MELKKYFPSTGEFAAQQTSLVRFSAQEIDQREHFLSILRELQDWDVGLGFIINKTSGFITVNRDLTEDDVALLSGGAELTPTEPRPPQPGIIVVNSELL